MRYTLVFKRAHVDLDVYCLAAPPETDAFNRSDVAVVPVPQAIIRQLIGVSFIDLTAIKEVAYTRGACAEAQYYGVATVAN